MISTVLTDSFNLYRRFFMRFVLTAAAVFVVLDFFSAMVDAAARRGSVSSAALWGIISAVISIIGSFWVQGALVEAVRDARAGGGPDLDVSQLFKRAQPHLGALIVGGLLAGFGVALGLILLVIPGLILLTRWSLLAPVIVIENKNGTDALGRSNALVRGYDWEMFGLIAITMLMSFIAQGILRVLFSWLPPFLAMWVGGTIAQSLVIPFVAIAWTLAYYQLLERKVIAPTVTPPTLTTTPPTPPSPPVVPPPMPPAAPTSPP